MDEIDRHDFRLPSEQESGVPFMQKGRRLTSVTSLSSDARPVAPSKVNYKGPQEWIKNSVRGKDGHYYDRETGALTASASQVELAKTLGTAKPVSENGDVTDEILKTVRAPGSTPEVRKAIAIPPAVSPVTAPTRPGSALDILSGLEPPNFDAAASATVRPRINPSLLTSSPVFPVEQPAPTGAEVAGTRTRQAVSAFGRALVDTSGAPAARNLNRSGPGAAVQPGAPIVDVPGLLKTGGNAVAGFGRGLLGRSTAAGATNASAAQFQQPTKANPVPLTPTSPAANIDRSENAIAKFGMTDAEFNRKKLAFAGF